MQPQHPHFAERVRQSFAKQAAMAHIGATLGEVSAGYVEIHLPYDLRLTQQHGFLHAGIIGTIADSAGGYAAMTLIPADASILSIEYKLNLLRPAVGERFVAKGRVVRAGRQIIVCQVEVFGCQADAEKLCALMQMTLMAMHEMPERSEN